MNLVRKTITTLLAATALTLWLSCGGKDEPQPQVVPLAQYLPESLTTIGLQRQGEILLFNRETLWEHIDGGAELCLMYDFRDLANVTYKGADVEMMVNLYRFSDSLMAYGYYSLLRPADATILNLGAEGFMVQGVINVVKGEFFLHLVGFDQSAQTEIALANLAEDITGRLPGSTRTPEPFRHFPESAAIRSTNVFHAALFLGQKFLDNFYSQDYLLGMDTVTLFLAHDSTGGTYLTWLEYADKIKESKELPGDLPFDLGYGFIVRDSYYGDIVAGLKSGKLVGMVGYSDSHKDFLLEWLKSLSGGPTSPLESRQDTL